MKTGKPLFVFFIFAFILSSQIVKAQSVVSDDSDGPFSILAQMAIVISPNGGENWTGGEDRDITWSMVGSSTSVNIDYSTDSGNTWNPVVAGSANDGIYIWTVPIISSPNCLIRVSDAVNATISDMSNAIFTITTLETISTPNQPTGTNLGTKDNDYTFTTGGSTSNLGHAVQYKFDWGDGTNSGWLAGGIIQASHRWSSIGTYQVKAMARCVSDPSVESFWSINHSIAIYEASIPVVLWNTFLGGSNYETGNGIVADKDGNIYITGKAGGTWGNPLNPYSGGPSDAFVAKLSPNGSLLWSTFLGGSSNDEAKGIVQDSCGNIYITGISSNTWGSVPLNPYAGSSDAFVAKLNTNGTLLWNTFLGQIYNDAGKAIAVDNNGNIIVLGTSTASWGSPLNPHNGGDKDDVFLVKLNANGQKQWHTFFGGSGYDDGAGIFVGNNSTICVTGNSTVSWGNPIDSFSNAQCLFVAAFEANGGLQWNTFVNGVYANRGGIQNITVDNNENIFVTGTSSSTWGTPVDPFGGGVTDACIVKLNASGARQWNTFVGGYDGEHGNGIAIDTNGDIVVAGISFSTWGIPQNPYNAGGDVFVIKLNSSGGRQWNTFFGGSTYDYGYGIAFDNSGSIVVTGSSNSSWGNPVNTYSLNDDVFVAKLGYASNSLSVISPNGDEDWPKGSNHYITWSIVNSITSVNIDYSIDGGGSWIPLAVNTPNNGVYKWTVSATPSNDCLVRVIDAANASVFDASNAVFTISVTPLTVISPNGGESWISFTTQNITWSSISSIVNVNIDYSTDNCIWTRVAAYIANSGTYTWTVPATSSTTYILRISDAANTSINDNSDAMFSVSNTTTFTISGAITLGGIGLANVVMNGLPGNPITNALGFYFATVNNNWTGTVTPFLAGYHFSPVSRAYTNVVADQSTQNYSALLNTYAISGIVTYSGVGLSNVVLNGLPGNPTTKSSGLYAAAVDYDWSGSVKPTLAGYAFSPVNRTYANVIASQSAQDYSAASNTCTISGTINLNDTGLAGVVMNGLPGNPSTNGSGVYQAIVPVGWSGNATPTFLDFTFIPSAITYTNVTTNQVSDHTAAFTKNLVVTAPNSTLLWERNKTYTITWLRQGSQNANVKIMLYKDTATLVSTIVTTTPNNGAYNWLVPTTQATGSTYFIKVQTVDNLIADNSNKFSIIVPAITVTAPGNGAIWMRGTTRNITWTTKGTIDANVKIHLYKGTTKTLDITTSTPTASGTFSWSIPPTLALATNYSIKVISTDNLVTGTSVNYFSIVPGAITVAAPATGSLWQRGVAYTITWTKEGTLDANVTIQLLKGTAVDSTIVATTPNDGSYDWTIPASKALATNYRIRVKTINTLVTGDSGDFAITDSAGLTVKTPNGNENLAVGSIFPISWTIDPSINEVKLEYSSDKGGNFFPIADNVSNSGHYEWNVPENFTFNGIIRVSDCYGKNWLYEEGVLEFLFKFKRGSTADIQQLDFSVWFGAGDVKSHGYEFAKVAIGRDMVRMVEISQAIEPLSSGWHEVKIRLDLNRDLGTLFIDKQRLLENVVLCSSPDHHFEPQLSIRAESGATLDLLLAELTVQVTLLDVDGNEKDCFTIFSEDFSGYDSDCNMIGSCWQMSGLKPDGSSIELETLPAIGRVLRLQSESNAAVTISKLLAIPDKIPFDISDRSFIIRMGQEVD